MAAKKQTKAEQARAARKKADQDLSKAHKGDNVEGSLRALKRLLGGS